MAAEQPSELLGCEPDILFDGSISASSSSSQLDALQGCLLHALSEPSEMRLEPITEGSKPVDGPLNGLAVILGWLGSEPRHLRRYSAFWEQQGWKPHVVTYPVWGLLSVSGMDKYQQAVMARLLDTHDKMAEAGHGSRLIFHTFSNTGWVGLGGILESCVQNGYHLLSHICGAVIDSAPQPLVSHKALAAGAFTALFPKSKYSQNDVRAFALRHFLKVMVQGERKRRMRGMVRMLYALSAWPQLYIYSTADYIIPHNAVALWMQAQQALGRRVSELHFQASPHVQHMRVHADLYTATIASFLAELPHQEPARKPDLKELLALPLPVHLSRKPKKSATGARLPKSISTGSLGNAALMGHARKAFPPASHSPGSTAVVFTSAAPISRAATLGSKVVSSSMHQQSSADAEGGSGNGASNRHGTAAVPQSLSTGSSSGSLVDSVGDGDEAWLARLDNQWEEGSEASQDTAYWDAEEHVSPL